jgi:hypothetical protein
VFQGKPTRIYNMQKGLSFDHQIELTTITLAKGERELGGTAILYERTTYATISSVVYGESFP